MGMIQLIIWIAVIFYIVQKVKKQNATGTQNKRQNTSYSTKTTNSSRNGVYQNRPQQNGVYQNRPIQSTTGRSKPMQTYDKNFAVMPEHKKVPPNVERNCMVEDRHRSEKNGSAKPAVKPSAVPNVQRGYTEALKQTREQKKATRMVAMRLYEGDPVPRGYRMVKCRYCAAENLIAYSSKGDYMCYFCHTDLK